MSDLVTIAGTPLPTPSFYSGNTSTLVDSGRNSEGKMIGAVIRDDVAKVELSWKYLTVEQWANICKLFKASEGGAFVNDVRFFDQTTGLYVTRQMYVNDRKANMFRRHPETLEVLGWLDCKLNLIEV